MVNHKHSTIVLILFGCIFGIAIIASALSSGDIDLVCDENDHILYRDNGTWQCGSLAGMEINVTVNNITNLIVNRTDYWDDLDTPLDITALGNVTGGTYNGITIQELGSGASESLFVGTQTGTRNCSLENFNVFLGTNAGGGDESCTISLSNTMIGYHAGSDQKDNSLNTYIGSFAGRFSQGSNNVYIGAGQDHSDTTKANTLMIDVAKTDNPLIYGEFDNDLVTIFGDLNVSGDLNVTGNLYGDGSGLSGISTDVNGSNINVTGIEMDGINAHINFSGEASIWVDDDDFWIRGSGDKIFINDGVGSTLVYDGGKLFNGYSANAWSLQPYTQGPQYSRNADTDTGMGIPSTSGDIYFQNDGVLSMNITKGNDVIMHDDAEIKDDLTLGDDLISDNIDIIPIEQNNSNISFHSKEGVNIDDGQIMANIEVFTNDNDVNGGSPYLIGAIRNVADGFHNTITNNNTPSYWAFYTDHNFSSLREILRIHPTGGLISREYLGVNLIRDEPDHAITLEDNTDNSATAVQSFQDGLMLRQLDESANTYQMITFEHDNDGDMRYIQSKRIAGNNMDMIFGQYSSYQSQGNQMTIKNSGEVQIHKDNLDIQNGNITAEHGFFNRDVNVTEDVDVQGNFTGNFYYAELYNHSGGVTHAIAGADEYINITTGTQCGLVNGFTCSSGVLTVQVAGVYEVDYSMSFNGGNGDEYHSGVGIDSIYQDKCHHVRDAGSASANGNVGGTCLLRLSVGEDITFMVENDNDADDIIILDFNMNLKRIGT